MATKQTSGGVTYDPVTGGPLDEPSALNLDARLREVGARITYAAAESEARDDTLYEQIQDVRAIAERPQYADNGDGTGTLLLSSMIADNGDGTGTIGA